METHVAAASGAGGFKASLWQRLDFVQITCGNLSLQAQNKQKKSHELNRKSCVRQSLQVRVDKMKDS